MCHLKNARILFVFLTLFLILSCSETAFNGLSNSTKEKKRATTSTNTTLSTQTTTGTTTNISTDTQTSTSTNTNTENPKPLVENNKCKTGHKLNFASCILTPNGEVASSWTQEMAIFTAPVVDVCGAHGIYEGKTEPTWHSHGNFSVCSFEALKKCPSDWNTQGIFDCTLEEVDTTGDQSTLDECPAKHKLYSKLCKLDNPIGPNANKGIKVFGPLSDVCPNACNQAGCHWLDFDSNPSEVICVEEELPLCVTYMVGVCRAEG